MKNNPLKNDVGQVTGAEQITASEQVAVAKLQQKASAKQRALLKLGHKSGSAAQLTATPQSEVTKVPPNLYQVPKINIPDNMEDMTRLVHSELTKIAESQSVILTLWEKLKSQAASAGSIDFSLPLSIGGGGNVKIRLDDDNSAGSLIENISSAGVRKWYVGTANSKGDVALYNDTGAAGINARSSGVVDIIAPHGFTVNDSPIATSATVEELSEEVADLKNKLMQLLPPG